MPPKSLKAKSPSKNRWPAMSKAQFIKEQQKYTQKKFTAVTPSSTQSSNASAPKKSQPVKCSKSPFRKFKTLAAAASEMFDRDIISPQSTSRQPPAPQLLAPQPTAPQRTAPQPSAPQPTAPQRTAPQPSAPQPTASNDLNFKEILDHLGRISVSSNLNENFEIQAKQILAHFESNPLTFSECNSSKIIKLPDDDDARKILLMCEKPYSKWRPIYTTPDGNCLFN